MQASGLESVCLFVCVCVSVCVRACVSVWAFVCVFFHVCVCVSVTMHVFGWVGSTGCLFSKSDSTISRRAAVEWKQSNIARKYCNALIIYQMENIMVIILGGNIIGKQ